jgi:hypothetical protein
MPDDPRTLALAGLAVALLLLPAILAGLRRLFRRRRPMAVIDGSNVMHWQDNTPRIAVVAEAMRLLHDRGYEVGVIFDANAGYKIAGRYMGSAALSEVLGLDGHRVIVVPKGEQADPWLLTFARRTGAVILSNDRFRDRLAEFPEIAEPGRLIRGGHRDGRLWLDLPDRQPAPRGA